MTATQQRWLIYGGIVLLVLILAAIISPGILFPALIVAGIASLLIWGVMAAEATRTNQVTETQRPPVPVYQPPVQPVAPAEQPTYAQGYQAQTSSAPAASWPFAAPPSAPDPQPHEASPGERYEDPLVQYPE